MIVLWYILSLSIFLFFNAQKRSVTNGCSRGFPHYDSLYFFNTVIMAVVMVVRFRVICNEIKDVSEASVFFLFERAGDVPVKIPLLI